MHKRSLSDEFMARSPNTQMYVKGMAMAIPTSKPPLDSTNAKDFLSASPNTRANMVSYGLISPTLLANILYQVKK